jgi:ATP-dependent Clp protease ATP-binding subunit ClpA
MPQFRGQDINISKLLISKEETLYPMVERTTKSEKVIQILDRQIENNSVLVGWSGVGKLTIAEGLVQHTIDEDL